MQIICVPIIVSVVVCVMQAYKKFVVKFNQIYTRIIPILALLLGGLLGLVCYYAFPAIIMAENWYMAIVVGAASGLSATGCNQIFKQLKQFGIEVKEIPAQTDAENLYVENSTSINQSNKDQNQISNANLDYTKDQDNTKDKNAMISNNDTNKN